IDLLQLELGHLRDAQPTAEYHQKQRAVRGMGDLGKEPLDVLPGESFGQGAPAPDKMTRLHRIAPDALLVQTEVKKMLQGIEPAVHGRPRAAMLMLVLHKLVHLAKRDLGEGHGDLGKEQVQIKGITRDGVCRELPAFQVRPKPVDSGLADVVHRLPPPKKAVFIGCGACHTHGRFLWNPWCFSTWAMAWSYWARLVRSYSWV